TMNKNMKKAGRKPRRPRGDVAAQGFLPENEWSEEQLAGEVVAVDESTITRENDGFEQHTQSDEEGPAPDGFSGGDRSADHSLGLYLHQMGAIALLSREAENDVTKRLEVARYRYRHAALCNWGVIARVTDTFEHIHAGQMSLDRNIDVQASLGLTGERIRAQIGRAHV